MCTEVTQIICTNIARKLRNGLLCDSEVDETSGRGGGSYCLLHKMGELCKGWSIIVSLFMCTYAAQRPVRYR